MSLSQSVPAHELMRQPVVLQHHSVRWSVLYVQEARRISAALQPTRFEIEHVGSTAIPWIRSKPVIDVLVGLESTGLGGSIVRALAPLGYETPLIQHEEWLAVRSVSRRGIYHIHIVGLDEPIWKAFIAFRDYLKEHPHVARAYERVKRELSESHGMNRMTYATWKSEIIGLVLEMAGVPPLERSRLRRRE